MSANPLTHQQGPEAYEGIADMARALSNPLRIEMLECLAQSPRSVESLAQTCNLPVKTVSHHLQIMKAAGFVKRNSRGRKGIYSLANALVARLWLQLRKLAEQQGRIPASEEAAPGISTPEFQNLLRDKQPVVIDVRPKEEFQAGHIPGAQPVPLEELDEHITRLPKDRPVVAVCRGPQCRMANWAVGTLRDKGFDARRYDDGMLDWIASGMELHRSEEDRDQ